ncbi:hypothetical protein TKK_0014048 [Trichogramma kaykai]|uniref:Cathepsin O n=1 Tax=Trichogramma kaykai TaxID=54128 RepID=A0ABD2WFQ2_9HYME
MEWKTIALTTLIVSLCFLAIPIKVGPADNGTNSTEQTKLFEEYVDQYQKPYRHNPDEYQKRFSRFQESLKTIETLNKQRKSNSDARYGVTKFSDMSEEEFLQLHLRPDLPTRSEKHHQSVNHHDHALDRSKRAPVVIPDKFDWRDQKVVTSVKTQGVCGACWAFSTIGVIETLFALKNGTLQSLSVQEMIDCAKNDNNGCEGGDICSLLSWLVATKTKIVPESNYPFIRKTDTCKLQKASMKTQTGIRVSDYTCDSYVKAEDKLLSTIVNKGPVATAVNALSWQNYLGGIIQYHCDGAYTSLNHAVEIVGYDKTGPIPFYIVKNSWGPSFGDKGYLYIAIGSNVCGIAHQASTINIVP